MTGKQYVLTTPAPSPASGFTVSAAVTVTGTYKTQYLLTLAITAGVPGGLSNITGATSGTFYDAGTTFNLTAATPVAESATKQWRFDNWTGDVTSSPNSSNPVSVTMDQPRSITANYVVQYLQTFTHSGLSADATGTVVTVNAAAQSFGALPYSVFIDDGASVTYSYTSPVTSSVSGKQYVLTTPAPSPASGYTVSGANTVTGTYKTQYQLTLAITAGVPGGLSNISGGTNGTYYDAGTILSLSATLTVADGTNQWGFDNWSGDATGTTSPAAVTMSAARSVTANYAYPTGTLSNGPVAEGSAGNRQLLGPVASVCRDRVGRVPLRLFLHEWLAGLGDVFEYGRLECRDDLHLPRRGKLHGQGPDHRLERRLQRVHDDGTRQQCQPGHHEYHRADRPDSDRRIRIDLGDVHRRTRRIRTPARSTGATATRRRGRSLKSPAAARATASHTATGPSVFTPSR